MLGVAIERFAYRPLRNAPRIAPLITALGVSFLLENSMLLLVMFLLAGGGVGMLGVAIERFAYRPLRDAPRIAPLITALGVSFFLQNVALLLFGADIRSYNTPELVGLGTNVNIDGVHIWLVRILVVVLAVVLMIGLMVLVNRTGLGRAMRGASRSGRYAKRSTTIPRNPETAIAAANINTSPTATGTPRSPGPPSRLRTPTAANAPNMKISPWAKFSSLRMP